MLLQQPRVLKGKACGLSLGSGRCRSSRFVAPSGFSSLWRRVSRMGPCQGVRCRRSPPAARPGSAAGGAGHGGGQGGGTAAVPAVENAGAEILKGLWILMGALIHCRFEASVAECSSFFSGMHVTDAGVQT